ncbi:hypothetical protein PORY_002563 [Pneumocystis oryctolagi]|uniref:Uncharacterized protein n=1 Tax=Pneumocystis oryctolagi TaxID=42067 RepID=A0ACB7C9C8_9ASCO|nr:hypothetical protein PORY_002563 [Pneumocystis oryctolagi]
MMRYGFTGSTDDPFAERAAASDTLPPPQAVQAVQTAQAVQEADHQELRRVTLENLSLSMEELASKVREEECGAQSEKYRQLVATPSRQTAQTLSNLQADAALRGDSRRGRAAEPHLRTLRLGLRTGAHETAESRVVWEAGADDAAAGRAGTVEVSLLWDEAAGRAAGGALGRAADGATGGPAGGAEAWGERGRRRRGLHRLHRPLGRRGRPCVSQGAGPAAGACGGEGGGAVSELCFQVEAPVLSGVAGVVECQRDAAAGGVFAAGH